MKLFDIFIMILIQTGFFAVLIWGLKFYFAQHLSSALNRLKAIQEEAMMKEAQLNEELNRAKQHRDAIIDGAREDAQALMEESKNEIAKMRNDATAAAHQEKKKIIEAGREELDRMSARLDEEVKIKSVEMAVTIVENMISAYSMSALQPILANEVVEEINKLDESTFIIQDKNVLLRSAAELAPEVKDKLYAVLKKKMHSDIVIEEEVDESLLGGFTLTIGEFVIDGSLNNKISKIVPYL